MLGHGELGDEHGRGLRHEHAANTNEEARDDEHGVVDGGGLNGRGDDDGEAPEEERVASAELVGEVAHEGEGDDGTD